MENTVNLKSKDGLSLFVREWRPSPVCKGVICLIHGFGEHVGRYEHVASFLNTNGYAVVGMDNRGFGQSEGKRGHTPNFESYYDDIQLFIQHVKSIYENTPLFLYGHSMGGNLVLNLLLRRNTEGVEGAIVTGPLIDFGTPPKPILVTIGKLMRSIYPSFTQDSGLITDDLSRDKTVVAAYVADPLVHGKASSSMGMDMIEAAAFLNKYSGQMPVSTLILHAEIDRLTSQPASEAFAKRVSGDVTYHKFEGLYHEIHNEPEKQQVFDMILDWLNKHI